MKQLLSQDDKKILDRRIADAESLTGAQIVLATVMKSDSYPEIPWKAFAIGSAAGALLVFLFDLFSMSWISDRTVLIAVSAVLVSGVLPGLLSIWIQPLARLFLSAHRAESEAHQRAGVMFLTHELFRSGERRGVLLMVSHFERQVLIIPDKGLTGELTASVLKNIISGMKPLLRADDVRGALEKGLDGLTAVLGSPGPGEKRPDDLSNEIIEE